MKKITFYLILAFVSNITFAQWTPVNTGLPNFPPTTIINWVDTMVVSTYGGGIYLTYDKGENWIEMPGTLPNNFVNKIMYRGGQFDPISVSTEGGPFTCVNGGYIDCNGTGLTNNSINFWSGVGSSLPYIGDAIIGTNGDGIFGANYTSPFIYNWFQSNTGISPDAMTVNDGIVVGEDMAVIATNDGVYKVEGNETAWTSCNNGLSGDALKVNSINYIGFWIISTDGGLYGATNLSEMWQPVMQGEKINLSFYINTDFSPSGFMLYAFGENGYFTQDFITWTQMDFGGIEGEITAAQGDSVNVYVGFTTNKKNSRENGGLYKKPLEQFIVDIQNYSDSKTSIVLNQNYPNPVTSTTIIKYSIEVSDYIQLQIFDYSGRLIKTLVSKNQQAGNYSIVVDAKELPSGVYYYSLKTSNNFVTTKKMVIL